MKTLRPYTYLGTVMGMCRECRQRVPARIRAEGGAVYQERLCPRCGSARTRIADDEAWYRARVSMTTRCKPASCPGEPVQSGCPLDCGPCAAHANACHLPVFSITNVCNLACPICFTYNRSDRRYFMSRDELRPLLDRLIARAGPLDLVNITGGEPTLHPELPDLIAECRRPEIGRVTLNSNGVRLAEDDALCRTLAALGVYVVLSWHTFDPATSRRIHGKDLVEVKRRALANLQRFGIGTTLLHVMIRGINDGEFGEVLALAKAHPVVRGVTVQTMTFTGQGGGEFHPRDPLPLDGAAAAIERATRGEIAQSMFAPHPGAHPLCYSVAFFLKDGPRLRGLGEVFTPQELRGLMGYGYLLQPDGAAQTTFQEAIDRLWAAGDPDGLLPLLKRLVSRMYPGGPPLRPGERQRAVEENLLAVYLHAHMDEDTLDLGRLAACPDQVPDPAGRLIPACAYNLFYRSRDPRFWKV